MKSYRIVWIAITLATVAISACTTPLSGFNPPASDVETQVSNQASSVETDAHSPQNWNMAFRIAQVYAPPKPRWTPQQAEHFAAHRQYFEINLVTGQIHSDAESTTKRCQSAKISVQAINSAQYLKNNYGLSPTQLATNLNLQASELKRATLVESDCDMPWAKQFIVLADKANLRSADIFKAKLLLLQGGVVFLATPYNHPY